MSSPYDAGTKDKGYPALSRAMTEAEPILHFDPITNDDRRKALEYVRSGALVSAGSYVRAFEAALSLAEKERDEAIKLLALINMRARSDGQYTFDECMAALDWIDASTRAARQALREKDDE